MKSALILQGDSDRNVSVENASKYFAGRLKDFPLFTCHKMDLVDADQSRIRSEELMSVQYSCKFCILREATLTVTVKKTFLSPAFLR